MCPKSAVASISSARCAQISRKRDIASSDAKSTNGRGCPLRKDVDLVHQQDFLTCFLMVRWATPAACEPVACDQVTNKLADVALGLQSILAELLYRAVDEALRDAEGHEEVLEEAVIPVAQTVRMAHPPDTKTEKGQEG